MEAIDRLPVPVMKALRWLAAALPPSWQNELKRIHYRQQIRHGLLTSSEPEYGLVPKMIGPGDWVIDVGANVGDYTKLFSDLIGPEGRVIALEPVPETFALLAANVQCFRFDNVTLVNAAASDKSELVGMIIPRFETGLRNFYQAQIARFDSPHRGFQVMAVSLDSLEIPHRVALVKIDTEGHEFAVLRGMVTLLRRDHPTLIVETDSKEVIDLLATFGYGSERLPGSPNWLLR